MSDLKTETKPKEQTKEQATAQLEETLIQKYMDEDIERDGLNPTNEEHLLYLNQRYLEINKDYKFLLMQKREIENTKNEQGLARIQQLFKQNYLARKFIVMELRSKKEKINDPVFPE